MFSALGDRHHSSAGDFLKIGGRVRPSAAGHMWLVRIWPANQIGGSEYEAVVDGVRWVATKVKKKCGLISHDRCV